MLFRIDGVADEGTDGWRAVALYLLFKCEAMQGSERAVGFKASRFIAAVRSCSAVVVRAVSLNL